MRKKSKRKKKASNWDFPVLKSFTLAEKIEMAREAGDGTRLRIPYSYHRIGRIVTSEQLDAEDLALKKRTAATKRRLKRLGLWD